MQPNLHDVTVSDRLAAEWLAPEALAYEFTGVRDERGVIGTWYVWRQGPVVASVWVIVTTDSSKLATNAASRYAKLQRDKLTTACDPCVP